MILNNPKQLYSRFLKGHEGKLHFAAHSHHFWPDVTRDAQIQYWDDCAISSDEKWGKVFETIIPQAQKHIARMLHLKDSQQIAFAPNIHELASRVLSLFAGKSKIKILSTTNEFQSWRRQLLRLEEMPQVDVTLAPTDHFLEDRRGVIEGLKSELKKDYDLFYLSQVFFDSGLCFTDLELLEMISVANEKTLIMIDGYHGFAAIPTDLSKLEGRIFYLAGGYKYAQAGEGAGFMVVPKGKWRPLYTGWFAEYAHLSKPKGAQVGYSEDGMAFMGATQDPSGLYRFNAVWDLFKNESISQIHEYVRTLQLAFIKDLSPEFISHWQLRPLYEKELSYHGHFLTFEAPSDEVAGRCQETLRTAQVLIDRRGARLRFGFGLYQNLKDVEDLTALLKLKGIPHQ
jgi:selenocysteine lyase/cysteine desulfurase